MQVTLFKTKERAAESRELMTLFETKELDVIDLNFRVCKLVDSDLIEIDVANGNFGISASHNGVLVGYTKGDAHGRLCLKTKPLELEIPVENYAAQLLNSKTAIQTSNNLTYFVQTRGCTPSALQNPQAKCEAAMLADIDHYETVAVGNMTVNEMYNVTHNKPVTKAIAQTDGQGWLIVEISCSQHASRSNLGSNQAKYIEMSSDQNKETIMMRKIEDHVNCRSEDVATLLLDKFSNLQGTEHHENKQLLLGLGVPKILFDELVPLKQHVITKKLTANGYKGLKQIISRKCEPFMVDWTCLDASKKLMLKGKFLRQAVVGTLEAINLAMTTMYEDDNQKNLPTDPRQCAQTLDKYMTDVLSTQAGVERLWHQTANASCFQAGSTAVYTSDGNVKFKMKVDTSSHKHPTFKMEASVTNDGEQQTILPRNDMLIDENKTVLKLGDCEDQSGGGTSTGQVIDKAQQCPVFYSEVMDVVKSIGSNVDNGDHYSVYEKVFAALTKCNWSLGQTIGMANGAEVMTQNKMQTSAVISNALQHWNGLKNPMQTGQKCGHSFAAITPRNSLDPHSSVTHTVGSRKYITTFVNNIKNIYFGECTAPTIFSQNRGGSLGESAPQEAKRGGSPDSCYSLRGANKSLCSFSRRANRSSLCSSLGRNRSQ